MLNSRVSTQTSDKNKIIRAFSLPLGNSSRSAQLVAALGVLMQVFGCEITGAGGKEVYCSSGFSFVLLFLKK